MEKEVEEFAKSIEGQNIIRLHDAGYKLADSQLDLTPIQSLFLIYGFNHKNRVDNEAMEQPANSGQGNLNHRNSSVREELKQKTLHRLNERGEM